MRYSPLPSSLFVDARKRLRKLLQPGAIAIVNANDICSTNADGTMGFVQNSDLFYLTGVDQEETILVLFPNAPEEKHREMLFLRETNEHIAVWEGDRLTKEQAAERSGIPLRSIHWTHEFEREFRTAMCRAKAVYLNTNEHPRAQIAVESRDARFIQRCQWEYPLHRYERLAPLMHELRAVKTKEEVSFLRHAISITEAAFRRVLGFTRPGVFEYEIEAEIIHEFIRRGAQGHAYTPIIGSGRNACVLHYIENHARVQDGEVVLMDFGARYGNYNADLTRTIPANGKFTPRQRAVYEAVLRVHQTAKKKLKPGVIWKTFHDEVGEHMQEELLKLKLITKKDIKEALEKDPEKPAYKKYYMHGTGHHLGLDVHDVGDTWRKVEAGMVFTIEPGIYIPDEKLGVRLENDVWITKSGNVDLMADIPIEAKDIEEAMRMTNDE